MIMKSYKEEFIHFMVDSKVLKFGDFVTKSGRNTPFFINTGFYRTGAQLKKLGEFYAKAIEENFGFDFEILFGPAYKGIPLSVASTEAIYELSGKEIGYCSNRKEAKDHGEGGSFLGAPINDKDRVLIIEDVTTAGTSIRETYPLLKAAADCDVLGLIVSVDRQEKGQGDKPALLELSEEFSMKTAAIVTMDEVIECLYQKPYKGEIIIDDGMREKIAAYYRIYGAS